MYDIENYSDIGFATPFTLSDKFRKTNWLSEYFSFQKKCNEILGHNVTLKPNLLSKFFDSVVFDQEIVDRVNELIGPNVYVWSSAIFAKAPGDKKVVSFHQDNPYWQLSTKEVVTAWVSFTQSDEVSGGMKIVPRSHKFGILNDLDVPNPRKAYLEGKKTTHKNDFLSYNNNLENFIEENPAVSINLSPGTFSLHHVDAVHGSGPNESSHYRIGYAIRYVSSKTRHLMESRDSGLHISGKKDSYFQDELRPVNDFDQDAVSVYRLSMKTAGSFGNKMYS